MIPNFSYAEDGKLTESARYVHKTVIESLKNSTDTWNAFFQYYPYNEKRNIQFSSGIVFVKRNNSTLRIEIRKTHLEDEALLIVYHQLAIGADKIEGSGIWINKKFMNDYFELVENAYGISIEEFTLGKLSYIDA